MKKRLVDVRTPAAAVRASEITFAEFAEATRSQWRIFAAEIMRRWPQPQWVAREDVEQDLLIGAWLAIAKYDEGRGTDLGGYVVWNAFDKAKKRAHAARNSYRHRHADNAPSRIELSFGLISTASTMLVEKAVAERHEASTATPADQEDRIAAREIYRALVEVCNARQRLAVEALVLAGGDEVAAASIIYDDVPARIRCRLNSEDHATDFVRRMRRQVGETFAAQ